MSEVLDAAETISAEPTVASEERLDNDKIQTRFIPAGDGPMQGLPQAWNGARSGVRFSSHWQDGHPVMTVHLEAEFPLEVNEQMRDEACLAEQAEAFDLALKVAIDDEVSDAEIADKAISLNWVRNYFARSYNHLSGSLEASRQGMEVSQQNINLYRRSRRSVDTLKRTVERMDARLEKAVPARIAGAILIGDPSAHWH